MRVAIEEFAGYCPICELPMVFTASGSWYRDQLNCPGCNSVPRERALTLRVKQLYPEWKRLAIHEIGPATRGFAIKLKSECPGYIASHWFSDQPPGSTVQGYRNENIEALTLSDGSVDIVLSLDVMEHIFNPEKAYREVYRTLKPGGVYVHTFPINKSQIAAMIDQAVLQPDGTIRHLVESPSYHGNPISGKGSLVTKSYGYDIGEKIAEWTSFDVEITRYWDRTSGIIGSFTEVIVCRKPAALD
jgi:SAM-dependent methyltransferase